MTDSTVRAESTGKRSGMDPINDWLYDRLRDSARPLFIFEQETIPGASVWTGARKWVRSFREKGLESGDRVVLGLSPGPAFVQVLVASLWEDLSLFVRNPEDVDKDTLDRLDARTGVVEESHMDSSHQLYTVQGPAGPAREPEKLRSCSLPPSPDVRLWLETSGSTGDPRIIGLSEGNLMSVVRSHTSVLQNSDCMLSYLPWTHCFGLVMDLMVSIDRELRLVRLAPRTLSPDALRSRFNEYSVDHFNTVPRVVRDLDESGFDDWDRFREGIVGGATIDESVASVLSGTALRVGYGQTEASPGITLGNPGEFEPGIIGQPVGCTLTLSDDQELIFEGNNAHRATFHPEEGRIERFPVPRRLPTGDLGEHDMGTYYFRGRKDHRFKLPNGRFLDPVHVENALERDLNQVHTIGIVPVQNGFDLGLVSTGRVDSKTIRKQLADSFAGLDQYCEDIHQLSSDDVPVTGKGEIDREAFQKILSSRPSTAVE